MKKYVYILICLLLYSCSIEEGKGGQAVISGRVFIQEIGDFSIIGGPSDSIVNEYPAIDERVYIKYGDNTIYDDDFDTDENGYFKFDNLSKGDYTLFTYSYCDSCDAEIAPIYLPVNLEKHKTELKDINFYIEKE